MEKFQNKYRIPSARLKNWDYGWNGSYFLTICTAKRRHFFGEIRNGEMHLNDAGMMADKLWGEIPEHFPFSLLGEYVIMPNHVHGILMIDKTGMDRDGIGKDAINRVSAGPGPGPGAGAVTVTGSIIGTGNGTVTGNTGGITGNHNPMIQENISRVIRWYKGRTTFELHKSIPGFGWQSRFHDYIIRDDASYQRISEYIRNNPGNWKDDELN